MRPISTVVRPQDSAKFRKLPSTEEMPVHPAEGDRVAGLLQPIRHAVGELVTALQQDRAQHGKIAACRDEHEAVGFGDARQLGNHLTPVLSDGEVRDRATETDCSIEVLTGEARQVAQVALREPDQPPPDLSWLVRELRPGRVEQGRREVEQRDPMSRAAQLDCIAAWSAARIEDRRARRAGACAGKWVVTMNSSELYGLFARRSHSLVGLMLYASDTVLMLSPPYIILRRPGWGSGLVFAYPQYGKHERRPQ